MAELDLVGTSGMRNVRALAAAVVDRYPIEKGADQDGQPHVLLPDGSRPFRKDLINRIAKKYEAEWETYCGRVALAHERAARFARRTDELLGKAALRLPHNERLSDPAVQQRLRAAAHRLIEHPPRAYDLELVQQAVRSCAQSAKSVSDPLARGQGLGAARRRLGLVLYRRKFSREK